MKPFPVQVTINKPVEEVFALTLDPTNIPKWINSMCSRLTLVQLLGWGKPTLGRRAFLDTPKASQSSFDLVTHCTNTIIPNLTDCDKRRTIAIEQWIKA